MLLPVLPSSDVIMSDYSWGHILTDTCWFDASVWVIISGWIFMMNFLTDGLGGNAPLHINAILFISLFFFFFLASLLSESSCRIIVSVWLAAVSRYCTYLSNVGPDRKRKLDMAQNSTKEHWQCLSPCYLWASTLLGSDLISKLLYVNS